MAPIPEVKLADGLYSFGFTAEYKEERLLITSLFEGSSADKADSKIGDEIISVNG